MTQPDLLERLAERLRTYRPTNEWGDGIHHDICTEAADTIEALTAERDRLREAARTIIGSCEFLEDKAAEGLATVRANGRQESHEAGFWRGQKTTAKSLRRHLADMARAAINREPS